MGKALAALVPALLLDGQGYLLEANDRAAELLQLENHYRRGGHYDQIISKRTRICWVELCQRLESELSASIEMYCHTGEWMEWQLSAFGTNYLFTGFNITSRRRRNDKRVFENLPVGLQQFTPEGYHVDSNTIQREIWGDEHPLFKDPDYNIIEDPFYQQIGLSQLFREALHTLQPARREILLRYKEDIRDGVTRLQPYYYEATVFPVPNRETGSTDLFLMLNEITAQKLAVKRLEKSERLLDNIVENLPIGYIQFDHYGFVRRVNHTQRRFFRMREAALDKHYNIMSDAFASIYGFDKLFAKVMGENKMLRIEMQMDFSLEKEWTDLQKEVWVDLTILPLQDPVNKKQIVVMLVNDITEQKRERKIRTQLQRNTEQLHLLFDAVDMGYATMERNGLVTFVNRKAVAMSGGDIKRGCNIFITLPEFAANTPFAIRFAEAMKSNVSESFYSYFSRMDKWYDFMLTPMPDGALSVFIRDITESRKMQKDLYRANNQLNRLNKSLVNQNQQLEDFAHITSHNLRAPIANLKALMQMYMASGQSQERELYLSMLQEVIHKIDETLNDLVDVVQIRKNDDVEREQLYFAERLQYVKDVLLVDIEVSGIQLTTSFEKAPMLEFPRVYLDSILQNLVTNAIRYRTLERIPSLHLKSWKENGRIVLTAEDNGLGIDMERFGSKLFGFRKTFHKNKDAKGIGLFITKTQVEAMGGSIRAESTPGEGTKFIITFKPE
ncbi:Signal transduction histidine kinase [Chitinophaga sp. CF118]|nr:Signal transduction histidine kinase [Chitinophaga sp. CF118]